MWSPPQKKAASEFLPVAAAAGIFIPGRGKSEGEGGRDKALPSRFSPPLELPKIPGKGDPPKKPHSHSPTHRWVLFPGEKKKKKMGDGRVFALEFRVGKGGVGGLGSLCLPRAAGWEWDCEAGNEIVRLGMGWRGQEWDCEAGNRINQLGTGSCGQEWDCMGRNGITQLEMGLCDWEWDCLSGNGITWLGMGSLIHARILG